MDKAYFVQPIQNIDGAQMIAIVYGGEYAQNAPISIELTGNDDVLTGQISAQETSAILGPIAHDVPYQLKITENTATFNASLTLDADGNIVGFHSDSESLCAASDIQAMATRTYTVHRTATSAATTTFPDLFKAINQARILGVGAVVKLNGAEVFQYGVAGRYYKYQFTTAYGYVDNSTAANQWLVGYQYSYIILSSTARFCGANYKTLKGTAASWSLEPNSGGYYYQYGQYLQGQKKVSTTVKLSQAKLRVSDNPNQAFTAYVYLNVHDDMKAYDLGLVFDVPSHSWLTVSNPEPEADYGSSRVVSNAAKNSNGEWVADGDIDMTLEITSEGLKATLFNQTTKVTRTITVKEPSMTSANSALVFLLAASYVPALAEDSPVTPDYRSGAYLKNLQFTNCKVYNASGTASPFFATSTGTSYSLVYNTDCCEVTGTSTQTTVNIAYDRA